MALQVIPDAEALVGSWLRDHADITALGARVAPRTPNSLTMPWIRVTQLDAPPINRAGFDWAIDYLMQFDCYAGSDAMTAHSGQAEASLLARTTRAVLRSVEGSVMGDVAISRVRITTHLRSADTAMEPARERVILVAQILMHPA